MIIAQYFGFAFVGICVVVIIHAFYKMIRDFNKKRKS
jgi:hypothetical protein